MLQKITPLGRYPLGTRGFTLIEILVSLFLLSLLFGFMILTLGDTRRNMEKTITDIERAVRYASDEATLRNCITRLQFNLDKNPQELTVEFGPDDSFVLPQSDLQLLELTAMSLKEKETYEKTVKNIAKKFNPIPEFTDKPLTTEGNVQIIGVGTSLINHLISSFYASVYMYPTGEKDSAIIILASNQEVVSLSISPFHHKIERTYLPIEENKDLENKQIELAKELYRKWLKN